MPGGRDPQRQSRCQSDAARNLLDSQEIDGWSRSVGLVSKATWPGATVGNETSRATKSARKLLISVVRPLVAQLQRRRSMQIGVESSRAVENKRVFVVDSDELNRAVLQFMLHDENETHELASLDAAYVKARDWKPDLVLLGLAIVQERGPAVLGEIAAHTPGVKIVVVTDTASDPLAQTCLNSGAHALLAKPFTVESVRAKVDLMLGRGTGDFLPLTLLSTTPK